MGINWDKYNVADGTMTDGSWPEKGQELKAGDSIEGRYIAKNENVGTNKSNVYIIEVEGGKKIGVWGSTVLDSKFQNIGVGKMVAIEYVGEKKGKTGKTYKDFRVGQGRDYIGDEKAPF